MRKYIYKLDEIQNYFDILALISQKKETLSGNRFNQTVIALYNF